VTGTSAACAVETGKAREPRRKVLLHGRMQAGENWVNVTIHNVSSRGLMAQCTVPLERGRYVEIRYRSQVIVGRVVWAHRGRFGLRTRDPIDLRALLGEPVVATAGERRSRSRTTLLERRMPAPSERYLASRQLSSMFQFVAIGIVTVAAALLLAERVQSLLAQPLGLARAAMGSSAEQSTRIPVVN
jgi:hypothetical protein